MEAIWGNGGGGRGLISDRSPEISRARVPLRRAVTAAMPPARLGERDASQIAALL